MKNVLKVMMVLMFCVFTAFGVSACGKAKIESAAVKSGTLETTIVKGDEFDTSNTVVIYTYSDNTKKEVSASELQFSAIDVNTIAQQTLTITYEKENYSFDVEISVVASEADVNAIDQLESALLNAYNSKRQANASVESTFKDPNQALYVGNDNVFDFRIIASGTDGAGNEVDNIKKVRTNIKVELKEDSTYRELTGTELTSTVTIDTENTTLKFAENVIDKEFRVTVTAVNANPDYEDYTYFMANIIVVDGYNVYDAKGLSLYDNLNKNGVWTEKKTEWGLNDKSVNALILQNDISITTSDVPAEYFWSTSSPNYQTVRDKVGANYDFLGTPIDKSDTGLYHRTIANGSEFQFIGNYFQIDLSQFPKAVIEFDNAESDLVGSGYVVSEEGQESYITSHLCVFFNEATADQITSETTVDWKNFNFSGNGSKNATPENSGAILLMKNKVVNFNAYNTLMNNFYIGYFFENGNKIEAETKNSNIGQYIVDSCKGYNSYQCLFYFYGAEHTVIKNSEFKGAGGPAIIANHVYMDNNNIYTGNVTTVDIVNSTIESYVTASSFWFSNYGVSSYVSEIAGADQLYTGIQANGQPNGLPDTGKTIVYEETDGKAVLNALGIILSENSLSPCQGYIRIFKTETDFENYYDNDPTNNPEVYGLDMMRTTKHLAGSNFADLANSYGTHFFESNGNGGYINSGVDNNLITTEENIVIQKLNGLHELMKTMGTQLGGLSLEIPNFNQMSADQKKAALITAISNVLDTYSAYVNANAIYQAGFNIPNGDSTIDLFVKVNNWNSLDADAQRASLLAQINDIQTKSYAEGEYINLYTSMGMGACFALYDNNR